MSLLTFKLLAAVAILPVGVIGGVIPLVAARPGSHSATRTSPTTTTSWRGIPRAAPGVRFS